MTTQDDKNPDDQIDLGGGLLVTRAEVEKELPNVERFERCLPDAKKLNADVAESSGGIPQYVTEWSDEYKGEVITTLQELGDLYSKANKELRPGESPE